MAIIMKSEQQETTNKKSVAFAASAKMRLALHVNQYTAEEIQACYYSSEDFRSFKTDVKRTAKMIEFKQKMDETVYCTRGVEYKTREGKRIRSKLRSKADAAVFKEQMNQFFLEEEEGKNCRDEEKLAAFYSEVVKASVVAAYITGLSDEIVAQELAENQQKNPDENRRSNIASALFNFEKTTEKTCHVRKEVINSAA
jgi:hypothetical protein